MNRISLITRFVKLFDPVIAMPKWKRFQLEIEQLEIHAEDFFFIQIGSNDGVIHDPLYEYIRKYHWQGILVEPIPIYFDRLRHNYKASKQLRFENLAISDRPEVRDFYRVKEGLDHLPNWSKGLGSFFPEVILKHQWAIPNLPDYLVKESVECIPFRQLLERHHVEKVDLLMIDTEGYDYEIVKQIDFRSIKPRIIIYEHKHLDKSNRDDCQRLLKQHCYRLFSRFSNTMAVLEGQ